MGGATTDTPPTVNETMQATATAATVAAATVVATATHLLHTTAGTATNTLVASVIDLLFSLNLKFQIATSTIVFLMLYQGRLQ